VDSVDTISKYTWPYYLFEFLKPLPQQLLPSKSENICQRSAILFQLNIKKTDFDLLKAICIQHKLNRIFYSESNWLVLREYAKTNERKIFVADTNLQILSRKKRLKTYRIIKIIVN
jgi:hypothetical protein